MIARVDRMTRVMAIVAAVAIVAMAGGTLMFVLQDRERLASCGGSSFSEGVAKVGGPFELLDGQGNLVTERDVIANPALVYFGFTNCPGVCPIDNARNAAVVALLEEEGVEVTPVFISVDPDRDTPEAVGEYAGYFHDRMIGLTGSAEQVAAAAKAYRVSYNKMPPMESGGYMVNHTTLTYLMLPEHGFVDFYRRDDTPEAIAEQVACYSEEAGFG